MVHPSFSAAMDIVAFSDVSEWCGRGIFYAFSKQNSRGGGRGGADIDIAIG